MINIVGVIVCHKHIVQELELVLVNKESWVVGTFLHDELSRSWDAQHLGVAGWFQVMVILRLVA